MDKIRGCFFITLLAVSSVYAQDTDSLRISVDTTFTAEDSLSIFTLIDSLLKLQDESGSQLAIRLAYNSNVLSAGRTLGIQNFGLSSGVSYYHKSGLYADLTSYWSKDFEPSYYLTVASLGYMRDFSKRFSLMAGYDRYLYSLADGENYIPYKNTLSLTPILELKPVSFSLNYSFYFGDQFAHRILPGISLTLEKKKFWNIDRIAIMPSAFVLLGNEIISTLEFILPPTLRERIQNRVANGTPYSIIERQRDVFGIMNYAITVPLTLSDNHWAFSFSYTYNIPKALPGESLTLSESTYLSGSLIYFIDLKRHNKAL